MLNKTGIGIYLKNILHYWLQSNDISWTLIGRRDELILLPLNNNCNIVECDIPIFSVKEIFKFPVSEINDCDLFFSPNFNIPTGIRIPIYITIHDVVFLDIKGLSSAFGVLLRRLMLYRAIHLAHKIFTVSKFSQKRIVSHFGNKKEIIVAYNGLRVDLLDFDSNHALKIYDFDYILFIGNIKKYKGLDILLKAMDGIDKKLVIIGSIQNLKTADEIIYKKIRLNSNIIFENHIESDKILYAIIKHASILIQPSRYEGFGIPPLESLYLGTPAIVSDIPVLKEVYGKLPVVFFKSGDADDLRLKINSTTFPEINRKIIENAYKYEETAATILSKMR
jgi:glycosyltransferase involved in cell wall biosynthesis